jgi:hypothetical protein
MAEAAQQYLGNGGGELSIRGGEDLPAKEIGLELRSCENSGSQVTPRWREMDSNFRFRVLCKGGLGR